MNIKSKRNPIAKFTNMMVAVFITLMPVLSLAGIIELPRTGQDTCWDTNGNVINCAGTGQDGDIQSGVVWPNPRFTDNGDSTMTDNLTGLMWTQDGRVAGPQTWQGALNYVAGMNAGTNSNFGHTDWRLPNILELLSLSNLKNVSDSNNTYVQWLINQGFTNLSSVGDMYWSSTSNVLIYANYAHTFNTLSVHTWTALKSGTLNLWPVRAGQQNLADPSYPSNTRKTGQTTCYDTDGNVIGCTGTGQDGDLQWGVAWPDPRLTDNGDGTVTDNLTGLTVLQDAGALGAMTWQGALDYVAGMNAGTNSNFGRTDWRLANFNEVASICDFEGTSGSLLPSSLLTNPSGCWTSDTFKSTIFSNGTQAMTAWFEATNIGITGDSDKNGSSNIWINSNTPGTPGPPLIALFPTNANFVSTVIVWDPINTYTGELFDSYSPDLSLGGPMPLFFSRYYASGLQVDGVAGRMGDNWLHNFEWTMTLNGTDATIISNKGRKITFSQNGASWDLTGKTDIQYQLVTSGTDFIMYEPGSEYLYTFDSTGKLTKIKDAKGNAHTLTYTGANLTQVSDGLGRTLNFTYNGSRLSKVSDGTHTMTFGHTGSDLTSVTDARGKVTNFTYDTGGLMTAMIRPESNTPYSQTWDTNKRVVTQTDANGNTNTIAYSASNTTMTGPLTNTRTHTYSSNGRITANQGQDGFTASMGYDSDGRRTSVTDQLGDTTTYTYHAASGKLASVTNIDGTVTTNTYTARTHSSGIVFYDLTGITYPDATTESFVYDTSGNMTSRTDRDSKVWTFTYNSRGQALTATNPSGGVTTFTYNADGTLATSKDASNNTTTYAYDSLKRLITITRADATTRTFTYDDNDNVLTTTDERGNVTTFTYDDNNNLATMKDRLNKTTTFAYDGMDSVTSVTDSLGNASGRTYDELERLKTTTDRNGNTTTYGYDARGRLTSITDGAGKIWARTYDAESIIASATNPLSNTTGFISDKMGRITKTTSPLNNVTDITYDSMGRVVSTENPLSETTTYSYDSRGLLTGISIPESISTTYTRNALGLITDITDPNGNVWKRAYDAQGRQTSRTDPLSNETSYEYDNRNRVSRVNLPASTLDLTYDNTSNVTRRLYSDATDLNYTYDKEGRLTGANGLTLTYDDNGRITNSNGLAIARDKGGRIDNIASVITYTYDSRDLLTSVTDWLGGTTSFTYDDAGRLTTITRPNGVNTTYTYDNDDRLVGIQEGSLSTINLTRDGVGQITNASRKLPLEPVLTNSTTTLTYDAASQVAAYTYDGMGRLTNDGKRTYIWDLASRLTSYTEGGNTVSFAYDALGNRTSRTEGGVTRSYIWNYALGIPSITAEMQGGSFLRFYIHTPGGQLLYSIDAATNARGFYHYDEMGNTLFITDNTGAVIAGYAYGPYGEMLGAAGSFENPFAWQGKHGVMQEGTSGLYYMRARYYDSVTARFISRDPVKSFAPRSITSYQYALMNPLRYVDPTGLTSYGVGEWLWDLMTDSSIRDASSEGFIEGAKDGGSNLVNILTYNFLTAEPLTGADKNIRADTTAGLMGDTYDGPKIFISGQDIDGAATTPGREEPKENNLLNDQETGRNSTPGTRFYHSPTRDNSWTDWSQIGGPINNRNANTDNSPKDRGPTTAKCAHCLGTWRSSLPRVVTRRSLGAWGSSGTWGSLGTYTYGSSTPSTGIRPSVGTCGSSSTSLDTWRSFNDCDE